ncbi:MAG: hypothetical protein L3J00_02835 [Thiomicrorhabdus sp.]|nr:hypothetical protein [Thiomicrorhabdus sp.]
MYLTEREFKFDFSNAMKAFKFDEEDQTSPCYHGATHCGMKAVDFIVEREHDWLFIEVKDYCHPRASVEGLDKPKLRSALIMKYKDTFLYRWAEGLIDDKPINYVCLVELGDDALILNLMDDLKKQLPIGLPSKRWKNELLKSVIVVNIARWSVHFPEYPVIRIPSD